MTLVFSDIHGNLPAFETMLKQVGRVDRYVSLGDVVNYGPWSNECVDLLETLPNCDKVMGNHDRAFLQGHYPGENRLVQEFFQSCFPSFDRRDALSRYAQEVAVGKFVARHTLDDRYIYPETSVVLSADCLIGHSHHQFCIESNGHKLYNAGSVGQNRRQLDLINYLLIEPGESDVRFGELPYNSEVVIAEMRARHFPAACVEYYHRKRLKN